MAGKMEKDSIDGIIEKTLEFERLMDQIDFNSLKEKEYGKNPKENGTFRGAVRGLYTKIDSNIESIETKIANLDKKNWQYEKKILQGLIKAKEKRLCARKKDYREDEEHTYIDATNILHKAFDKIDVKHFKNKKIETLHFYDKFNWLKILCYNEFSICYSGLAESSMSLGYAEKAIELLKKICPDLEKDIDENSDKWKKMWKKIPYRIRLYTFALYNKAEAERLRHNYISSLQVFRKIISIYDPMIFDVEYPLGRSDYYSAYVKIGIILADQGRGTESIESFNKVIDRIKNGPEKEKPSSEDARFSESKLEKASAYIDQKEYSKAWDILEKYRINKKWKKTFFQRSANVRYLRFLNEWKKNRDEKDEEFKNDWDKFTIHANKLLKNCLDPLDGNNFKKTCKYLAEYCNLKREEIKEDEKQTEEKWVEREIDCYYLLSLSDAIFEKQNKEFTRKLQRELRTLIKKKLTDENFWEELHGELKKIKEKLSEKNEKKSEKNHITKFITQTEDTEYLEGFFYVLNEFFKQQKKQQEKQEGWKYWPLFENIEKKLVSLYTEKDNLKSVSEVDKFFERRKEEYDESKKKEQKKEENEDPAAKFIENFYFKKDPSNKHCDEYLSPYSIVKQMKKNTDEFTQKIVFPSDSIPLPDTKNGELQAILMVLRRWNSFTPALADTLNPSKGGGYFLLFKKEEERLGIVIDPGYDFLDNFFSQGFSITDIDTVVISHCHPDHTNDFPSLLSLFHERNKKLRTYYTKRNKKNQYQKNS